MFTVKRKLIQIVLSMVAIAALCASAFAGAALPAHADGGVYPRGVYGPGGTCCYDETGVWYDGGGRGFAGHARWTWSNGNQVSSIAEWNAGGLDPNTSYDVCAYIPDNNANANATYNDSSGFGDSGPRVINQAAYSNQWAFVDSVFPTSDGHIVVTVSDKSDDLAFSTVIGADAMMFIPSYNDTIGPLDPNDQVDVQCTPNFPLRPSD
jgi:hypothetical protein